MSPRDPTAHVQEIIPVPTPNHRESVNLPHDQQNQLGHTHTETDPHPALQTQPPITAIPSTTSATDATNLVEDSQSTQSGDMPLAMDTH